MHTIKCKDLETMIKIDGLEELWIWVLNIDNYLRQGQPLMFHPKNVDWVKRLVTKVSDAVRDDYPFYADELPRIIGNTFLPMGYGYGLNISAFWELFIITKHLHYEPQDISMWALVHPRIALIAKKEYLDGHYASAANRSYVEVETRLRELFKELKPGVTVPVKVGDLIGALLSDSGVHNFCDMSTQSGKDYRKGVILLFEGCMAAYRNPSSHENKALSKAEAFEQIMLASQLMKVLDNNRK
jgi:uncharacterized protein (TIGR02391 family)